MPGEPDISSRAPRGARTSNTENPAADALHASDLSSTRVAQSAGEQALPALQWKITNAKPPTRFDPGDEAGSGPEDGTSRWPGWVHVHMMKP